MWVDTGNELIHLETGAVLVGEKCWQLVRIDEAVNAETPIADTLCFAKYAASEAYKCLEHLPDNMVEKVSISRVQRNELRRKIALAHFANPSKLLGV